MENRSRPFMTSHQLNKTAKQYQQLLVEEQSTKRDSSNLQAAISQAQSLDEVMKRMPLIPSSKEEKPQFVPVCNQGELSVKQKEIK